MDLRKETIKTEGRKPLLVAFLLASVGVTEFQTTDVYSSLDGINIIYNLCIHSRVEKVKAMFVLVSWDWVRVSPLGTSATNWPIVPAPDDRWWWMWSSRWNENWQGKPKYSEKKCLSATSFTTHSTWPDLGLNPDRHGGNSATNSVSYGTALKAMLRTGPNSAIHWEGWRGLVSINISRVG
jgi:hypothetical protein